MVVLLKRLLAGWIDRVNVQEPRTPVPAGPAPAVPSRVEQVMKPRKTALPVHQCTRLEPSLDQMFDEPIVRRLMARDGVTELALRRLISEVGERLGGSEVRALEANEFPLPD